jgi:uncharacterized membrane protein
MKLFRELGAGAGIVAAILLVLVEWSRLPAAVPTHFGWSGAPNGYGSRMALWSVVLLMIFIYGMLILAQRNPCRINMPVPRGHERRGECESLAAEMVSWVKLEVMWLLVYVVWAIIRAALNDGTGVRGWFAPIAIALVGGTVVIYRSKMRQLMA